MAEKYARVLMLGDLVGDSGLRAVFAGLPALAKSLRVDLVVANGENAQDGFGIGRRECDILLQSGVQVITGGNHIWERKGVQELLASEPALLRPANYPQGLPGRGMAFVQGRLFPWLVINLQGRTDMYAIDCPFRVGDELCARARYEHPGALVVVDFHAEFAEEKEALAWQLDGRAAVVAGTHTHTQTADERILPKGTGYITDLGMCGPVDSVIGVKTDICIRRSLTQMPLKMETADSTSQISGALFTIDPSCGRCVDIQRIKISN